MSAPFDLSDALKTPPTALDGKPLGSRSGGGGRRPPANVRLDEAARKVIWVALTACVLLGAYLLFGLFAAQSHWAKGPQGWGQQNSVFRLQQLSNIAMVTEALEFAAVALIGAMLAVFRDDEGAGYTLLATAAVLYAGVPLLANQFLPLEGLKASEATNGALRDLQTVGLVFGVPGLLWSCVEMWRRFRSAAEAALIKQANARYAEASTARSLGGKAPARRLTAWQRQQRRYQTLSVIVLIGEPLLVLANLGAIKAWMGGLLSLTERLSFSTSPSGVAQLQGSDGSLVLWTLLIALNLVLLSQLLRLLEYACYRNNP
jgi:hypothetical protein